MIGGPQGSGVESGANIFSRACAEMGYHVFGKREFYSNIKGEHSYFVVRISDEPIHSNADDVTLMASFDAETIFRHFDEVSPGGGIIYDMNLKDVDTSRVHTLDAAFKGRLHEFLEAKDKPFTIDGALSIAKERGVNLYPVSFKGLLENMAREVDNPKLRGMIRMYNVIGISLSMGLIKTPMDPLIRAVESIFSKKPRIADINKQMAEYSYNHAASTLGDFGHTINKITKTPNTILTQGHQGSAIAKMVAGCRFQSYYPITPASDESFDLESNEILPVKNARPGSTAVIQTEDEISAIGMMIGAALTGTRSSTSTSGPGFALMTEALGWAGINEVPIVITLYQRSGPSTGLPTRHGQDDLLFTVFAGHGDFPKIVYASGDIHESFYDTGRCFNYADIYQVPTIHMMDKFISSSVITCQKFKPEMITINRGKLLDKMDHNYNDNDNDNDNDCGKRYQRFALTQDGISPRSKLGLDNGIFWNTGDESDEYGHITEDPHLRTSMMDKRMSRMDLILQQIPTDEQVVSFGTGDHMIISWGSAKGPIIDAQRMLKREGINVGFVQIKLIHPFPTELVRSMIKDAKKLIDIEANYSGQLGKIFKQNVSRDIDHYILKYTGRGMTCTEVYDAIKKIIANKASKREILTHGA